MKQHESQSLTYLSQLVNLLHSLNHTEIDACVDTITDYVDSDNRIFTNGNGGSATTASHYVTDWAKMTFLHTDRKLNNYQIILDLLRHTPTTLITRIFAEQLKYSAKSMTCSLL